MTATFETWLRTVFDHPAEGPEWYWGEEFDAQWDALEMTRATTVDYLTRLYRDPSVLAPYSLPQVSQGLWFLLGDSPAQPSHALLDREVPLEARLACVRAVVDFFRRFVAVNAPGPADTEGDAFHCACYMWWDNFPTWGGAGAGEPSLHEACLETMREILALPSEVCQLSALHGLGHWKRHHPGFTRSTIDAFLRASPSLPARVRQYALAARDGCIQ